MANRGKIFDPRGLEELVVSGYFPSTATIEQPVKSRTASGDIIYSWAILEDHENIPCSEAIPISRGLTAGGVEAAGELVTELYDMRVALSGYYPNITPEMRVRVAETQHVWGIVSVLTDPQGVYTELNCRRTNPEAEVGVR